MKLKTLTAVVALFAVAVIVIRCGKKEQTAFELSAADFLPDSFDAAGLTKSSETRVFPDTALWEYIDGGAEQYLAYNVAEVGTADYTSDEAEITVDIYMFDNANDAFGLYSMKRPEDPTTVPLGVDGFSTLSGITFVEGVFVVDVIGFDESPQAITAVTAAADELDGMLPGTRKPPVEFSLFPGGEEVLPGDKYYRESFLGRSFLRDIFTREYPIGGDTVVLFLSHKDPGPTLLAWSEEASRNENIQIVDPSLPFDDGKAFITQDSLNEPVIAGIDKNYLVGMVGYQDEFKDFLVKWLKSFPKGEPHL
jgi:hypothetical protein